MRSFLALTVLLSGLVISSPIAAQQPAAPAAGAPQATTATYDDWLMRCEARPSASKICEVAHLIQIQGQQGFAAQVIVGRLAKDRPYQLIVQLPAGVWLPAGVAIEFGDKITPLALAYTRCLQACFADLELKPEQLTLLKGRAISAKLVFEDGARNKVRLPLSLRGFAAALDASQS